MNKQIIKRGKKISIIIAIVLVVLGCGIYGYHEYYLPHYYQSLYNQGLKNLEKADSIADELCLLQQHQKAMDLLMVAAECGITKSQTKLALYLKSYKDDYEQSSFWYQQAALKGDSKAQYELGIAYLHSYGVKQDFEKALYWIEKSANNNDRWAQYLMGNFYLNGLAYYDLDDMHINYWYAGNNRFRNTDMYYTVSNEDLDRYLSNPKEVFLIPSLTMAKHYWTLSANQGCEKAKEALRKIYE